MPLNAGAKLGPYEVLSLIGTGGMGEVYKAKDTRLGRTVAIKVAKADFTERFEREARAVAALNHPNICSLYDVGPNYLVMEYLAGDRLRGPLPIDIALRYAGQICDAMAAAHAEGVIHRDLKPANIMVTKSGVKVLDFGLAKIATGPGAIDDLTVPESLTQSGMIIGTPAYMAPEQIEGLAVDARTDIFALGCILYEILSGRSAFQGKSPPSLIAAILKEEPPKLCDLQPQVSPGLERVVMRCLAKDPGARWQNAQDVKHAIQDAREETAVVATGPGWKRWIIALAAGVVLALAGAAILSRPSPRDEQALRLKIAAPPGVEFLRAPNRGGMALSPDGRLLAFTAVHEGQMRLWIQPIHSSAARELPGTERAHLPFWSPDNRSLGFFADGKLKRIDTDGGRLQVLANAAVPQGATWGREGIILFSPDAKSIYKIGATGGSPMLVASADASRKEAANQAPAFLADGKRFLYWVTSPSLGSKSDVAGVYLGSLADSKMKIRIANFDSWVTPAETSQGADYLMWVRGDTVVTQPWDSTSGQLKGEPIPLGGPVGVLSSTPDLTVSENGLLVYGAPVELQLTWVDRSGKTLGVVGEPGFLSAPRLSPDGAKVVYRRNSPDPGLVIADMARGISSRIVSAGNSPNWSPDGSEIAFDRAGVGAGGNSIVLRRADGTGSERTLPTSSGNQHLIGWLKSGASILYYDSDSEDRRELRVADAVPGRQSRALGARSRREPEADISPDGQWLAYTSDEGGRLEIFIEPLNFEPSRREGRFQVSSKGGVFPRWRRDGQELFYVSSDGELMSVSVKPRSESFELSPPRSLFSLPAVFNGTYTYDVSPDGQRFLIVATSTRRGREPLSVIVNWPALLSTK